MYWRPYLPNPVTTYRPHRWWAAGAILSLLLAIFFAWLFDVRFWKYRECIAAARSSCITDDGDNLIAGGAFWALPAMVFGLAAIGMLAAFLVTRPRK
jgi:hypothetical protein